MSAIFICGGRGRQLFLAFAGYLVPMRHQTFLCEVRIATEFCYVGLAGFHAFTGGTP